MFKDKTFKLSFWPLIITLTAFVILCKLGFWQLDRAEKKQKLLVEQAQAQRLTEDGLLDKLVRDDLANLNLREVQVDAELFDEQKWLVDNKVYQGKVGYELVVPARIAQTEQIILVSLGWWPAESSREQLPNIELPSKVRVSGLLKTEEFATFSLGESQEQQDYPKRVQSLQTVVEYSHPQTVASVVLFADSNTIAGHPRLYEPVVMPPEKHRAYALQWFLLAFFSIVVFVAASWRTDNKRTEKEKANKGRE